MPVVGAKHCLGDVFRKYADLVVPGAKIQLGGETGTTQLIDDRDWKFVFYRVCIERTIVDAETPCLVMLLDKDDWGGKRGVAFLDNPLLQHSRTLPLQLVLLQLWIAIGPYSHRWCAWLQPNVMVPATHQWQASRLDEDAFKLPERVFHEGRVMPGNGVQYPRRWSCQARPGHQMAVHMEGHLEIIEVPQNGP